MAESTTTGKHEYRMYLLGLVNRAARSLESYEDDGWEVFSIVPADSSSDCFVVVRRPR